MADSPNSTTASKIPDAYPRKKRLRGSLPGPGGVHPQSYLTKVDGDCLAPIVLHGETVCCEPILPVSGELAVFFVKGRENGSLKRLTMHFHGFPVHPDSEVVPIIQFEQLNPPKRYRALGNQFDAIHRVRWVMRGEEWLAVEKLLAEHEGRKEVANG